ncbi:MAG: hypothetical protein IK076_01095 [Bacteroidales bacterium]|nr:hypothetical protein [Bacteroidales bacterium]
MTFSTFASLLCILVALSFSSCKEKPGDADDPSGEEVTFVDYSGIRIKTLPERKAGVYWGWDRRWHEITDPANRGKWNYVRENLTGFYTNFIDMWCMVYQNSKTPEETCKALYETFAGKSAFFEATMETKVNDGQNGYNNEETDRRTLDLLTGAGFSVDYASVNYMTLAQAEYCKERMKLVATYKGDRKCLTLVGPWCFNGNIGNDKDAMEMSTWGDGLQTDGPLGYWKANQGKMREGSYSIVKRAALLGKESAVMLAPYDAGIASYNQKTDFLAVSKDCVFGHEDNGAMPDLWTLWMYGAGGMELFPESSKTDGQEVPQCTGTGVAWWLLKHLNTFPVLNYGGSAVESASIDVGKGKVTSIPLTFSNKDCPVVELSPVLRVIFPTDAPHWKYKFTVNGVDVTNDMVFNGGLNCVGKLRLMQAAPLTVKLHVLAEEGASPLTMEIEAMPNLSNTVRRKTVAKIVLNP